MQKFRVMIQYFFSQMLTSEFNNFFFILGDADSMEKFSRRLVCYVLCWFKIEHVCEQSLQFTY